MNALENSEMLESEPVVSSQQLSEIARGRSRVYTVLAEVLNQMPNADLLRALRGAEPLWSAARGGPTVDPAAVLRDVLSQVPAEGVAGVLAPPELVTELAVERTRLLRGVRPGYGLPPACESVYRHEVQTGFESQEPGRAWAHMLAEYRRSGFSTPKGLQPDYIRRGGEFSGLTEPSRGSRVDTRRFLSRAGRGWSGGGLSG